MKERNITEHKNLTAADGY